MLTSARICPGVVNLRSIQRSLCSDSKEETSGDGDISFGISTPEAYKG